MKKVTKFRDEIKLPAVKLCLDDLEEIEKIIKNDFKLKNDEELVIKFITGEYEYNIKELKSCKQKEINDLEIRCYCKKKEEEVEFDLNCITDITILFRKTNAKIEFDNKIEIKGVALELEKFISKSKQKITSYVKDDVYISLLLIPFIFFPAIILFDRIINESTFKSILFFIIALLVFILIYLIITPVSVIVLEHKKESSFWKRNSDKLKLSMFSNL